MAKEKDDPQPEPDDWTPGLEEYLRQGEPGQAEKSAAWRTAIGLQKVDGLTTSPYLLATAKEHIEGGIDVAGARRRIERYYEAAANRRAAEAGTMEADIVAARIAELLAERAFQFSPAELRSIHRRLFHGLFDHAGAVRTYNISKKEWVLNGETVIYAACESIAETLDYDFAQEKQFSYAGLSLPEAIRHLAGFTAGIWQIHPFGEGNTRTTAVFVLRYLRTFGFQIDNAAFAENSWYFRNALVRANYNDLTRGVHADLGFLVRFFENLLTGAGHQLKNRYLHIDYNVTDAATASKGNVCTLDCPLDCTLEELAVLRAIARDPAITQKKLAKLLGKSERTIKTRTAALQTKGHLRRANGRRAGHWELSPAARAATCGKA